MQDTNLKLKVINDHKWVVYFDVSLKLLLLITVGCLGLFIYLYPIIDLLAIMLLLILLMPLSMMANENVKMIIDADGRKIIIKKYVLFGLIRKTDIIYFEDFFNFSFVTKGELDNTSIDKGLTFIGNIFRNIANTFGDSSLRKEDFFYFVVNKKSGENVPVKLFEDAQLCYYQSIREKLTPFMQKFLSDKSDKSEKMISNIQ